MTTAQVEATTSKPKPTKRVNAIGRFLVDKVDAKAMLAYAKASGGKVILYRDQTPEQMAVNLSLHFRENFKEDDLCKCDTCAGEGPETLATCPFCGVEGTSVEEPGEEPEAEVMEADDGEIVEVPSGETEAVVQHEDEVIETKVVETPAPKKKASLKSIKGGKVETSTALATTNGKVSKLAKVSPISEKDLDNMVAEIILLKTGAATNYWKLGQKLYEVNERALWKARVDENGKQRYTGFDQFVHNETNITPAHAYDMMRASQFYSAEDIAKIGQTKAAIILKAPPEDRKQLQEAAEKGASVREIKKGVQESNKKSGGKHRTPKQAAGAKGGSSVPKDRVTVAKIEGSKTLKLYAKPASMRNLDFDELKRAKSIKDTPFGRLELVNGVVMIVTVYVGKDGNLECKLDTRRE